MASLPTIVVNTTINSSAPASLLNGMRHSRDCNVLGQADFNNYFLSSCCFCFHSCIEAFRWMLARPAITRLRTMELFRVKNKRPAILTTSLA